MNFGRAFTYVFEDEDWVKKLLIGGVINLIPVVGVFFTIGYMLETLKNVMEGRPLPLPEWDDWGGKFMKGLMYSVIQLVYSLPLIVLSLCFGMGLMGLVGVGAAAGQGSEDAAMGMVGLTNLGLLCFQCVNLLYMLVMIVLVPGIMIKYAENWEFGAAFRLGEIFNLITANIGIYLLALVIIWLAGLTNYLGMLVCGVGMLFTSVYQMLVMAHAFGEMYRAAE